MAKRSKIVEDIKHKIEQTPIERDDILYNKKIKATVAPEVKIGLDNSGDFLDEFIGAMQNSKVDIGQLEAFTQTSQNRNQVYDIIDTMAQDSTIASVLELYAEDATETNQDGRILWPESDNPKITKFITYLLDVMNVDKNTYKWIYSLIKYGDLYLRLYRESDYNDKLFETTDEVEKEKHAKAKNLGDNYYKILNECIDTCVNAGQTIDNPDDLTEENQKNLLTEDINFKLYKQDDKYVNYIEAISNPAEMYELMKLGRSYAYINAPTNFIQSRNNDIIYNSQKFHYAFRKRDVSLFEATEFVHAALEDNTPRVPEEVNIYLTDDDDEQEHSVTYKVRRGQSAIYNAYKAWRALSLLEYALLLNRVTKSSIVRIIGVNVGDMPKESVGPTIARVKSMLEQKSALDLGTSMSEYISPGPIENNVYVPIRTNGIGSITPQQIGGDVDVKDIADIDYYVNKLFSCLKIPKQYLGFTDDSTGFNGGTALSMESSRYAKTIKRIQNTYIQAITDAVNLMLLDKGMDSYVNKFELHMVTPATQEEQTRYDTITSRLGILQDIMLQLSDLKLVPRLKIINYLLADSINEPGVTAILQEEIDKYEDMEARGIQLDMNGEPVETPAESAGLGGNIGDSSDFSGDMPIDFDSDSSPSTSGTPDEPGPDLPTPEDLGVDLTSPDIVD